MYKNLLHIHLLKQKYERLVYNENFIQFFSFILKIIALKIIHLHNK